MNTTFHSELRHQLSVQLKIVIVLLMSISIVSGYSQNVVSKIVRTGKNNYIEVGGQPYLMYGVQMRLDNYFEVYGNQAPVYQYFEKASTAGFRTVIIPVNWFDIESAENVFGFKLIDSCLVNAKKYNLRIQLIWFGSNVCGWSNVPAYIDNDQVNYPRISTLQWAPLKYDNQKLIAKEVRAVKTLMNYISLNDIEKRIIMIQVENEPDHKGNSPDGWWAQGQQAAALHMMDTLGKVVHASNSNMVTRVNLLGGYTDTVMFKDLNGIDIIGTDLYDEVLTSYKSRLKQLDCSWNVNHTPENGGQYTNGINLACAAFENGSGYLLYELRTTGPKWFTGSYDFGFFVGTLTNDWVQRPFYNDMKTFNEMLYKADKKIARCAHGDIATFNQINSATTVSETKTFGQYTVTYTSANGGEAIALVDELGDIILMSHNDNSIFTFANMPGGMVASVGKYDDANQWQLTRAYTIAGNSITLMAGEVLRMNIQSIPIITANTQVNGGTMTQTNKAILCGGGSFVFNPQTTTAGTWRWSGPNGFTSTQQQAVVNQASMNNSGTYTVTFTSQGGSSNTATFVALVNTPPSAITSGDTSICKGESVTLSVSGGGAYAWSSGQNQNKTVEWHFNADGDFEGWRVPIATDITGSNSDGILKLAITGINPFVHSMWPLNLSPADYTKIRIRIKNETTGTEAKISWITNLDSWNANRSQTFTITDADAGYKEYTIDLSKNAFWTNTITQIRLDLPKNLSSGDVHVDWIKITGDQSFLVSPQTTTTYTVTTTDKNACATTNAFVVTVNALPAISPTIQVNGGAVAAANDTSILAGQSLVLSPLPSNPTGWTWSGPNSYSASTRQITFSPIAYNQAGTYLARYTDKNGCSASISHKISIKILQTMQLNRGWNLISTNVIPSDSSIAHIFAGLDVREIKDMNTYWRKSQPELFNSLKTITAGKGYLVNMNAAGTLSVTGTPVKTQDLASLQQGWSLIGCPYQSATPIAGLLGSNFSVAKDFTGFWTPTGGAVNSINEFVPGKAYFIKAK